MIIYKEETVFDVGADCIVNTINCEGYMGKGLALEFACRYPKLEEIYINECKLDNIHVGEIYYYNIDGQKIINFPTKKLFRFKSQMIWLEKGLDDFINKLPELNINSIAFPILGSSNGGLDATQVLNLMVNKLKDLPIDVYICYSKKPSSNDYVLINKLKDLNNYELMQLGLSEKQATNLKNNINNVHFFSDLVNMKILPLAKYKGLYRELLKPKKEEYTLFNM